jgi:hypothetical protein
MVRVKGSASRATIGFMEWSAALRGLLERNNTAREAANDLRDEGCELLTVFGFLWQYTACTDSRETAALGFRQLTSKFSKLAKQVRVLAERIEQANQEFHLPPETHGEDTTMGALRYSITLPTQLRNYAFFLENGPVRWVRPYRNRRKWSKTDRLILLATYVEAVTRKKHYADLTHLLDVAFQASGQEKFVEPSFIRNTCRQFPTTNAMLHAAIKRECETYNRLYPDAADAPCFIQWLESKRQKKH